MAAEKLIFIDPGYLIDIGHYENYGRRLQQAARQQKIEVAHYVNLGVPNQVANSRNLFPFFPHKVDEINVNYGNRLKLNHIIDSFAAKLRLILLEVSQNSDKFNRVRLFMYTGHPRLLPVIAELMNIAELDNIDIAFHFSIFYVSNSFSIKTNCSPYIEILTGLAEDLERLDPGRRVHLFADSNRTVNVYRRYFSRPIGLLPIPLGRARKTMEISHDDRDRVWLAYLGYTNTKQGYHHILRFYKDLMANENYRRVGLKIRHNIFSPNFNMITGMRELVGSRERIENEINYMTPAAYENFIESSDIVLIPHSRREYPVQTSGLLVDALCRGKIVVVPENTWLSDQIVDYGAGVSFSQDNYESFRDGVFQAIDQLPDLKQRRTRNLEAFANYHSPDNLLQVLFDDGMTPAPGLDAPTRSDGDCVELLSLKVLDREVEITHLVYAEKMARRTNLGWHYMLDLVWLAAQLRHLPPGSLVLDAGAGGGLMQYVLIRMGLRVISVDFVDRKGPADVKWVAISAGEEFNNAYVKHLKDNYSVDSNVLDEECILHSATELDQFLEDNEAQLIFLRSDISEMTLISNASVDAVVSVSALEHNELEVTAQAVEECLRVLKPGGKMLATVSATDRDDWFHLPSKGWCYSQATLQRLFQLDPEMMSNFDNYQRIFDELNEPGNELQVQLAPFYFNSNKNGMPWGKWRPEYLPVGTRKIKPGE